MWRTVIVSKGERITVYNNNIRIVSNDNESLIPIQDIYALLVDNRSALISVNALSLLSENGAHIYFCNEKHIPVGVTIPYNQHFQPLAVFKRQLKLREEFKDLLWQKIIISKIENQALCLKIAKVNKDRVEEIMALSKEVQIGDKTNVEAYSAQRYFKYLYGSTFNRRVEDITNASLNYGYTILRSSIAKTLSVYGYNCIIGIHHKSEENNFNLADDIIEPFRPIVDLWTDNNCDNLLEKLSTDNKKNLINLTNKAILFNNKKMLVRNAIEECISSLTSAIIKEDISLLKLPTLIPIQDLEEE